MHAYSRTEADQTDSIAVCATKGEWRDIVTFLVNCPYWPPVTMGPIDLTLELASQGVEVD